MLGIGPILCRGPGVTYDRTRAFEFILRQGLGPVGSRFTSDPSGMGTSHGPHTRRTRPVFIPKSVANKYIEICWATDIPLSVDLILFSFSAPCKKEFYWASADVHIIWSISEIFDPNHNCWPML